MKKNHLKLILFGVPSLFLLFILYQAYYYISYSGDVESITFKSNGYNISGVLVKPHNKEPYPTVLILHGSGPHKHNLVSYKIHTNIFTRAGFAVLTYDKRGVGESEGDFENATYKDFIDDAMAGIKYLKTRSDIDINNIGLFGSSEGGWFTPQIANTFENISFVINRCGPPLSWEQTNLFELENELIAENFSEKEITEVLSLRKRVWDYYRKASKDSAFAMGSERKLLNKELEKYNDIDKEIPLPGKLPKYEQNSYIDLAYDFSYNPIPYIKKSKIPMLYIFAENDQNVPTLQAIDTLNSITKKYKKDITIKVIPNIKHSLQKWTNILRIGYTKDYLESLSNWAAEHIR
jgi:uncharacterized protein